MVIIFSTFVQTLTKIVNDNVKISFKIAKFQAQLVQTRVAILKDI